MFYILFQTLTGTKAGSNEQDTTRITTILITVSAAFLTLTTPW